MKTYILNINHVGGTYSYRFEQWPEVTYMDHGVVIYRGEHLNAVFENWRSKKASRVEHLGAVEVSIVIRSVVNWYVETDEIEAAE